MAVQSNWLMPKNIRLVAADEQRSYWIYIYIYIYISMLCEDETPPQFST
jgi:hypothetical protein